MARCSWSRPTRRRTSWSQRAVEAIGRERIARRRAEPRDRRPHGTGYDYYYDYYYGAARPPAAGN